jgi:amino acid permease
MEDPKRWPKVLLVSTCVISIIYFIMGVVGYLVYGNGVKSPIYKSLPLGKFTLICLPVILLSILSFIYIQLTLGASQNVAMLVITFHVILIIPFYLYVFTMHIESWLGVTESQNKLARTLIRTAEMVFCCVVAMFVPFFSDFMTLVGTLPSEALTFILPSLFWLKLSWDRPSDKKKSSRFYIECLACVLVASIGVFCAVFGTIDAVKELVHDYST